MTTRYLNRDLSWLSFNGRVLDEAGRSNVPLIERIKFLSIYSSNLDEFYRVRMPALMLLHQVRPTDDEAYRQLLQQASAVINEQQERFGSILTKELIPALKANNIYPLYNQPIPDSIAGIKEYFQCEVSAFLEITFLKGKKETVFLKSNALYQAVMLEDENGKEEMALVNIPSGNIPRFYTVTQDDKQYIVFLDDIIKKYLYLLFPNHHIKSACNIKITRDAELDLADEYEGDIAQKIERQLLKRDDGAATRFLYEPGIALRHLEWLMDALKLSATNAVQGGHYHNLKDLGNVPVKRTEFNYPPQPSLHPHFSKQESLFKAIKEKDRLIHTPYQSYNTVLRFFNEAATDTQVEEIYTTLYRVAGDSRIVNALITAARNGKKVTVFIELKARFDEENNIRWSKRMKAAGISIINSIPGLKVHAKVALVKRKQQERMEYIALLATGNLNEITARFYTDHILITGHPGIVRELELLFIFLQMRRKPKHSNEIKFQHLLVAQFNLQRQFLELIDNEINNARQGKSSGIIIKMNNLEEKVLISKLYEASQAGVHVKLIVRSICCLEPGVAGMSENITVTRIVDRYLEHGRIFIFNNAGDEKIFMGSADWMNRNIYRRIEVCFPVYDELLKQQMRHIIALQLADNIQAVKINSALDNELVQNNDKPLQSQTAIYHFLNQQQSSYE